MRGLEQRGLEQRGLELRGLELRGLELRGLELPAQAPHLAQEPPGAAESRSERGSIDGHSARRVPSQPSASRSARR